MFQRTYQADSELIKDLDKIYLKKTSFKINGQNVEQSV